MLYERLHINWFCSPSVFQALTSSKLVKQKIEFRLDLQCRPLILMQVTNSAIERGKCMQSEYHWIDMRYNWVCSV